MESTEWTSASDSGYPSLSENSERSEQTIQVGGYGDQDYRNLDKLLTKDEWNPKKGKLNREVTWKKEEDGTYIVTLKKYRGKQKYRVRLHGIDKDTLGEGGKKAEKLLIQKVSALAYTSLHSTWDAKSKVRLTFDGASRVKIEQRDRKRGDVKRVVNVHGSGVHSITGDLHNKFKFHVPSLRPAPLGADTPENLNGGYGPNAAVLALAATLPEKESPRKPYAKKIASVQEKMASASESPNQMLRTQEVDSILKAVSTEPDKSRLSKQKKQTSPLKVIRAFHRKNKGKKRSGFEFHLYERDLRGSTAKNTQDLVRSKTIKTKGSSFGIITPRHKRTQSLNPLGSATPYPKDFEVNDKVSVKKKRSARRAREYILTSAITHTKQNGRDVYVTYLRGAPLDEEEGIYQWWRVADDVKEEVLWKEVHKDLKKHGCYFGYQSTGEKGDAPVRTGRDTRKGRRVRIDIEPITETSEEASTPSLSRRRRRGTSGRPTDEDVSELLSGSSDDSDVVEVGSSEESDEDGTGSVTSSTAVSEHEEEDDPDEREVGSSKEGGTTASTAHSSTAASEDGGGDGASAAADGDGDGGDD